MEKRTQNATFDFGHMDFDFAPNRWEYDFYNSKSHFRLPFTVWGVKYLKGPNLGKPIPQRGGGVTTNCLTFNIVLGPWFQTEHECSVRNWGIFYPG